MSTHEHGKDDCVDYIERIVYFIDNELDQADCAVVEMHLRECGPCLERHVRVVAEVGQRQPLDPEHELVHAFDSGTAGGRRHG